VARDKRKFGYTTYYHSKTFSTKREAKQHAKNMRRRPGDLARVVRVKNGYAVYTGSSWSK